jgi:hypothetical protein
MSTTLLVNGYYVAAANSSDGPHGTFTGPALSVEVLPTLLFSGTEPTFASASSIIGTE